MFSQRQILFLSVILALFPHTLRANIAAGGNTGPPVTVTQQGPNAILSNGIITATIDIPGATVTSIRYKNHEMVSNGGGHRTIYFSRDGGAGYENLDHCTGSFTARTSDIVDLSCRHTYTPADKDKHAWDVDVHFVLRHGASGLYIFAAVSHPASYPEVGVGEWRMVWSTPEDPRDWLNTIYVDDNRHWIVPAQADFPHAKPVNGPKEVTLMTTGSWAGRMDCKYMYAAKYWDLGCWGFASDQTNIGAWVVFGSHEFFNDGPNKQDLTAAIGTTLVHLNMNHFDGTSMDIHQGQLWHKFYGPWLLYFNHKASADGCWHDAQEQARAESTAWPYNWLRNKDYPNAKDRGSIQGKLIIDDKLKPNLTAANAWVGLAAPETGPNTDFQCQSTGYQFWVHAAADGSFTIPAVRPGNYELYAYVTGAVGQFSQKGITVRPGSSLNLGNLPWQIPHHGKTLAWEIGIPDRDSTEFAHGKDYYLPLLYQKLWTEIPNPLDYTIGQSNPATDWPYVQSRHGPPDHPDQTHYRIHFKLNQTPAGPATLTLAFAGADRAHIGIYVNNETRHPIEVTPAIEGGNGLVRETSHTRYCVSYVTIPTASLHTGDNTITLVQESIREDQSYIMYDYLSLELP